ncbi:condensation domain-containing protein [Kitasatospora sp. NPDC048239]|uniref:condensation domain-containing protein n=1 Tax=Kitasatospora sp. NPDC048239 TaxID=3364046 RepID=UPI00371700A8
MNEDVTRARVVRIPVGGRRSGTAPLTWAQRLQWNDTEWMKPHDHHFNQGKVLAVPPGCGLPELVEAVGAVVTRHESLRTRYPVDADGGPVQRLADTEELLVPVYRTSAPDPARAATRLCDRLRAERFELTGELPLRLAVLEHEGRPRYLVLVVSHVTLDYSGLVLLTDELDALLHGRTTPAGLAPVHHQHFDQAAAEATPRLRQRSAAALGHWEQVLRAAPVSIFDPPAGPPVAAADPDRFGQVTMVSPALTLATGTLADRLGVSSTTVLMAALNVVLGTVTGRAEVPVKLIASNRGLPELRDLVGIALGSCVTLVRTRDRGFPEVVRDTGHAALRAYRRAQCDPVALSALRAAVSAERGVAEIELSCGFNDMRPARTQAAAAREISDLLPRTEVVWDGPRPRQEVTLWYWAQESDGVDVHHALVDLHYLPRERTEELLLAVERVIVSAAVEAP